MWQRSSSEIIEHFPLGFQDFGAIPEF